MDRFEKEMEDRAVLIAFIVLILMFALSLTSCRTTHTATEVYLHDTLRVHTSDTIYQRIVTHHTDTVRDKEVTRIILKESGDTIKVYNDHYIYRYVERNDSAVIFKAKVDSLLKILDQRKEQTKVVEKRPSIRDKLVFILIVALVIIGVFKWIKH